jgi:ketosteroid isomerase-like protein
MSAKVLRDAKEALESLNVDQIIKIYAAEFLFEDTSSKEQITDQTSLREYFQQLFALPQVSFSDIRIIEADQFAVIEWTWGGVKRSTGEPFRVKGVSVMELAESKITRESIYYDPRPALS